MKVRYCLHKVLFCILLLAGQTSFSQSYGLAFASNEVVQDKRTGIDLSPGTTLSFDENFELEFDISVAPNKIEYFGYIVRVIENNQKNIDLIYDNTPNHFKVVVGEKLPEISFNVPGESTLNKWHTISLRFDVRSKMLMLSTSAIHHSQHLEIGENSKYKILFGQNNYSVFQTTDVPPVKIRNIRIRENGNLKFEWPLDEDEGNSAVENIGKANAAVSNPLWIRKMHREWQSLKTFTAPGPVSTAFDRDKGIVYIVGYDSLFSYNIMSGVSTGLKYQSGRLNLLRGNQSYYNPGINKIQNIYPDQKLVSTFDPVTQSWDKNFVSPAEITDNWHFNKYYSLADSSLYILSGYGHFKYKNEIRRYGFFKKTWDTITAKGDFFTPRYFAGLGQTADGVYLVGGYGSQSGQQILNPKNLYDLVYFDSRTKAFKKIYELESKKEDFVFANSLVVDKKERSFYGLVFSNHKFNSALQLVKGSLDTPAIRFVANKIPYRFHDTHSFSDLYYCPASESFVAVSLFLNDNDQTEIAIYSLASPPLEAGATKNIDSRGLLNQKFIYIVSGILILFVGVIIYWKRKQKVIVVEPALESPLEAAPLPVAVPELAENPEPVVKVIAEPARTRNSVFLFGDLQLFDVEGTDITKYFTPLIKELFLVILLYTIRKGRGISSEKLKELLWFDKTVESARNNRSVNITKLKSILDKLDQCSISKETGYWKIIIDYEKVYVDYFDYLNITNDKGKLDKEKIQQLANITQRGSFLSNVEYDWLETFKSEISNMVIDTYLHYAASIRIPDDPEFLVQIANYIFDFDSVNEAAMIIKCKALVFLGKHSLAKHTFENFNKEYKILYGEEFAKGFHEVVV